MSQRNPVTWPIIELLDQEFDMPASNPPERPAMDEPVPADAVYMAQCDVFLTRDGSDAYTLTLKYRGKVSEIRLTAGFDDSGQPALVALVA